jgi:hypothetical protein
LHAASQNVRAENTRVRSRTITAIPVAEQDEANFISKPDKKDTEYKTASEMMRRGFGNDVPHT